MSPSVLKSLQKVQEKITEAEKRAGRAPGSVTIVAASKTKSADLVVQASQNGIFHFGENYVQEAIKKIQLLQDTHPELKIKWHLIGALQTNKTKLVVGKFDTIQSVDRLELATALNSRAAEAGITQNIFLQVKLGDEPTKAGVAANEAPALIEKIMALPQLRLQGLMSLPPIEAEAEGSRKYFSELRNLRDQWSTLISPTRGTLEHLSMGTTHDFEIAIEEGATMVRVGTAIFGERNYSKADH